MGKRPTRGSKRKTPVRNELHPSRDGFKAFVELFYQKLKVLFPNRVL